ncbi:hypothetical protein ABD76_09195 [Paenibacillus dendritiformis]|uniref:condensation domain-containing protein n=1 Tax=Paenibacillus dendritiformis TaxID=130049 RepID=UPI0018CFB2A9|nr:condensation domain-containing protein [Paenibacillus dendritiformis]MBG9792660.1 hypothetical protein [Paenibacillus dendritiformis]
MTIHTWLEDRIRCTHPVKNVKILMHEKQPPPIIQNDRAARPPASAVLNQQGHFQWSYARRRNQIRPRHPHPPQSILKGSPLERLDDDPRTLAEAFEHTVRRYPDRKLHYKSLPGEERTSSYAQLWHEADRMLGELTRLGLAPGDAVILQVERIDLFVPLFWACVLGGFMPAPLKPALHLPPEHAERSKLEQVWRLLEQPLIISDDPLAAAARNTGIDWNILSPEELLPHEPAANRHSAEPGDHALYLFTSGTTGTPKCICYRHSHVLSNIFGIRQHLGLTTDEVTLNWMPLYHAGGLLTNHILGVVIGSEQVLGSVDRFLASPVSWLDDMEQHRVTFTWSPNFGYSQINQLGDDLDIGGRDLSSVRTILNVGQPISVETAQAFLRRLSPCGLSQASIVPAYGMTEFSGSLCFNRAFDPSSSAGVHYVHKESLTGELAFAHAGVSRDSVAFAEIGTVIPGVTLRIVDQDEEVLPEGCVGRIQLQGETIIDGYYKNESATRDAFNADGWFETGDLGFMRDGKLTLTGREKDVLIVNAKNVYNFEVESAMAQAYGIDPAYTAAAGLPGGEEGNDQLVLFFSPMDDDMELTLLMIQELRGIISRQFGVNPRYIIPVSKEKFPRTPTGKVQRRQLVDELLEGHFDELVDTIDSLLEYRLQQHRLLGEPGLALMAAADSEHRQPEPAIDITDGQGIVAIYYSSEDKRCTESALYVTARNGLKELQASPGRIEVYRQPTDAEKDEASREAAGFLLECYRKLLGVSHVSERDDFFQLGGDSLRMSKLLSMIASRYQIAVSPRQFFHNASVAGLLQAMKQAERVDTGTAITAQAREGSRLPLTLKQKSQWILHMIAPGSPFYTHTFSISFDGVFHLEKLRDSLRQLIERHEALRVRFGIMDGEPYQYIIKPYTPDLQMIDMSGWNEADRIRKRKEWIRREANTRFDLLNELCLRLSLIVGGEQEHTLVVSMHHIMSDGWSVEVFVRELMDIYEGEKSGGSRPAFRQVSYSDYVIWQASLEQDPSSRLWTLADYWQRTLAEPLPVLQIQPDLPPPETRSYAGNTIERIVDSRLTSLALDQAGRSGVTLFMLLLAIYSYLMHRFTKHSTIPIGTVMANRERPEMERLIGFVANTVLLCVHISDDMTFDGLLEQVKDVVVEAYQHQEVPFEMVLPRLSPASAPGAAPGFQVMFTLQNEFTPHYQLQNAAAHLVIETGNTAKYDLILHVYEDTDFLRLRMEYNTDLYKEDTIERLLDFYITMLEGVVEHQAV